MCSYPVNFEYIVVDSWSSLFTGKFSTKMHKEFQSSAILPYSSHLEASSNVDAIGNFQASTVDWNARRRIRPRQIEATWGHCGPLHKPWKDIAMEKELGGEWNGMEWIPTETSPNGLMILMSSHVQCDIMWSCIEHVQIAAATEGHHLTSW